MDHKHTLTELNNCSREELITMVLSMQGQLDMLNQNIEKLIEQVRLANSYRFGKHTETLKSIDGQLSFFDEAEAAYDASVPEPSADEILPTKRSQKKTGKRDLDLKDFPVEILPPYHVSKEELDAFYGDGNWRQIPSEIYKRLRYEPASWTVEVHTVEVYVGTDGDHQDEFIRGERPKDLLRNSIVTPSLLAAILNVKYVNSSALHRIEQEFERNGVKISRQTMSNWLLNVSDTWLQPIYEVLHRQLCREKVLHGDETTLQVLKEPGKAATSKSYMWLYRTSGCTEHPIVLYEYQPNRKAEHAEEFLKGFSGWLHADGYHGYHRLPENIRVVGCWAHARRKFDEALQTLLQEKRKDSLAAAGECYCSRLFQLEKSFAELTPEERHAKRLEQEKPVLDALLAWANAASGKAAPKSALGRALHYLLEQWPYLIRYLEDGRLELSNNRAERSIKPFVMGRKNWLFANTPGGAQSSSVIYSLIETAKENGLDPYRYLLWVLRNAPAMSQMDEAWAEQLLPASAPQECRIPKE